MNKVKNTTAGQTKSPKLRVLLKTENVKSGLNWRIMLLEQALQAFYRYRHQNDLLGHATLLTFDWHLHYHHRLN